MTVIAAAVTVTGTHAASPAPEPPTPRAPSVAEGAAMTVIYLVEVLVPVYVVVNSAPLSALPCFGVTSAPPTPPTPAAGYVE